MIRLLALILALQAVHAADEPPRILCLATAGVNTNELWTIHDALVGAGYAVDIAGPADAVLDGAVTPDLPFAAVDAKRYVGLFIPGGKSPATLEHDEQALALCRQFAERPIVAICHGPRLLGAAGMLRGKVVAALHDVADEVPVRWRDGSLGTYRDQAVVQDGLLVTGRFPNDGSAVARAFLRTLAPRTGVTVPAGRGTVLVWAPGGLSARDRYLLHGGLPALGDAVTVVVARTIEEARAVDSPALVVWVDGKADAAVLPADLVQWWTGTGVVICADPIAADSARGLGVSQESIIPMPIDRRRAAALLRRHLRLEPVPALVPSPIRSAIAVMDGCDEQVVAAAQVWLTGRGLDPVLIGPRLGWMRGQAGGPLEATATYGEAMLAADACIVAPGGIWPGDTEGHAARTAWLQERAQAGSQVLAVGHDAWRIGVAPAFAGKPVATSAQLCWSFPKDGGRYSSEAVEATTPSLLTARGFADCAALFARAVAPVSVPAPPTRSP